LQGQFGCFGPQKIPASGSMPPDEASSDRLQGLLP
jgi:hypothetical protein